MVSFLTDLDTHWNCSVSSLSNLAALIARGIAANPVRCNSPELGHVAREHSRTVGYNWLRARWPLSWAVGVRSGRHRPLNWFLESATTQEIGFHVFPYRLHRLVRFVAGASRNIGQEQPVLRVNMYKCPCDCPCNLVPIDPPWIQPKPKHFAHPRWITYQPISMPTQ